MFKRVMGLLFLVLLAPMAQAAGYLLKAGDKLDVTVWQDAKLNRQIVVAPDGQISFPFVGHFQAGGRTLQDVERFLHEGLQKQYKDQLDISVAISQIKERPIFPPPPPLPPIDPSYFVTGEVKHPGKFFSRTQTNVLQAISLAEGLGPFAASKRIQIHRKKNGRDYVMNFDYDAFMSGKVPVENIWLHSGDVIVVPEKGLFE